MFLGLNVYSQVGINTTEPGAQLDIVATDKDNPAKIDGILIPRIKKFPSPNPGNDQYGMLIFLSEDFNNSPTDFYYWHQQEGKWKSIVSDAKAANFYKPNTTESPGNIEDDLFRKGNIGIGSEDIVSKLQIAINPDDSQDIKKGLEIDNNNSAETRNTYGIEIRNRSKTDALKYGLKLNVSGEGEGERFGIHNVTNKTNGSSNVYGIYNKVGRTEGANSHNYGILSEIGTSTGRGNIYAIYGRAEGNSSSRVFTGYFAGRVGIGKTQAEEYRFPDTRGEENQILVLEDDGEVNWQHNHTLNYVSTVGNSGTYTIGDEVYFLRVSNSPSSITIPDASANKGRELILIGWQGSSNTSLNFQNGDTLFDLENNTNITSIAAKEILTIRTRWLLIRR